MSEDTPTYNAPDRGWIRVRERLPEKGACVWHFSRFAGVLYGRYIGLTDSGKPTFAGTGGWLTSEVTFWQPAPTPPIRPLEDD